MAAHRKFTLVEESELCSTYLSGATLRETATKFGCSEGLIRRVFERHGIEMRPRGAQSGERNSNWRTGKVIDAAGYVRVIPPPEFASMAHKTGPQRVLEHRLVMAQYLGRPLTPFEQVHHINGERTDNRIENLQLRIGAHGKGQPYACLDCGSERIGPVEIKDVA